MIDFIDKKFMFCYWDGSRAEIEGQLVNIEGVFWVIKLKNDKLLKLNKNHIIHYREL
jgi:hypothetical protein